MALKRRNPILDVQSDPFELFNFILAAKSFCIVDDTVEHPVLAEKLCEIWLH